MPDGGKEAEKSSKKQGLQGLEQPFVPPSGSTQPWGDWQGGVLSQEDDGREDAS